MGSGPREPGRSQDEAQRSVTLSRGFLIKKVPVTQGQWQEVMGGNPSHFKGEKNPVEGVNFFDALAFCNALSREHGLESCYELVDPTGAVGSGFNCKKVVFKGFDTDGYRLPTEAEWEFAARAGVAAARQGVLNEVGWYANNSRRKTHPVASKQPNAWGLYDTLGNVWEWVWDRYDPSPPNAEINPIGPTIGAERVQRGGCYSSEAKLCRLSNRGHSPAHRSFKSVGFRIVRTYN
jgi:formylglycine-generating enzyme required for sulfatase activity